MGCIAFTGRGSTFQAFEQQTPVGQTGQFVIERQPLNFSFGPFAIGNVTGQAPVPHKTTFAVKNGLSADRYPHKLTVHPGALHLEVMKHLPRL